MSEKIVQLNEEVIKGQLKELVRGTRRVFLCLECSAPPLRQRRRESRGCSTPSGVLPLRGAVSLPSSSPQAFEDGPLYLMRVFFNLIRVFSGMSCQALFIMLYLTIL